MLDFFDKLKERAWFPTLSLYDLNSPGVYAQDHQQQKEHKDAADQQSGFLPGAFGPAGTEAALSDFFSSGRR